MLSIKNRVGGLRRVYIMGTVIQVANDVEAALYPTMGALQSKGRRRTAQRSAGWAYPTLLAYQLIGQVSDMHI